MKGGGKRTSYEDAVVRREGVVTGEGKTGLVCEGEGRGEAGMKKLGWRRDESAT